ncbi:unnamed protein product, partial [Meganyctiphanes norvegica]
TEFFKKFKTGRLCKFYYEQTSQAKIFAFLNIEGHPGCVGFLSVLLPWAIPSMLIKRDPDTGEHLRDEEGRCIKAAPGPKKPILIQALPLLNEIVRFLSKTIYRRTVILQTFSEKCVALTHCRTLLHILGVKSQYYSLRWRGENVSTTEVEGQVARIAGDKDTAVYGVQVEGQVARIAGVKDTAVYGVEGQVARIAGDKDTAVYGVQILLSNLIHNSISGTYKLRKSDLQKEGYDINLIKDPLFFLDAKQDKYVPLTSELYDTISEGKAGL